MTDQIKAFDASRAKLGRAARHLQEVREAVDAYFAGNPCTLVVEPYFDMPEARSWVTRIRKPVPIELAAIIGDVVHNLRAALDVLICDLARVNGHGAAGVYFPFCEDPSYLRERMRQKRVYRAGKDVEKAIEALKPYKGGNALLRCIHDMDVADKHQALLPTIGGVTVPLRKILGGPPNSLEEWSSLFTDGHMVIGTTPELSWIPLGTELPARFFLCFAGTKGEPAFGQEAVKFLEQLSHVANGVVETLAALRPGAVFPVP
jgi:hypothetical protein